jgi:hypothetical protein
MGALVSVGIVWKILKKGIGISIKLNVDFLYIIFFIFYQYLQ